MTKLIDCPICKKKGQPVREDAKVCSPYCRLKQWRKVKANESKQSAVTQSKQRVTLMNKLKLGYKFLLDCGNHGKITGLYALGFHYHTIDSEGNCIKGQQYMLKTELKAHKESNDE